MDQATKPDTGQWRAVFLDRDGTLVHARHYPARPDELVLFPNLAPGLVRLREADFLLVLITNQAGLAHGYFSPHDLDAMHAHLQHELQRLGVQLDALYHCPHHPDGTIAELALRCACRKPQPGMLLRAAADRNIDLGASWMIGDILHDVEAGNRAGCRTILVDNGGETEWIGGAFRTPHYTVRETRQAFDLIAAVESGEPQLNNFVREQVEPHA